MCVLNVLAVCKDARNEDENFLWHFCNAPSEFLVLAYTNTIINEFMAVLKEIF